MRLQRGSLWRFLLRRRLWRMRRWWGYGRMWRRGGGRRIRFISRLTMLRSCLSRLRWTHLTECQYLAIVRLSSPIFLVNYFLQRSGFPAKRPATKCKKALAISIPSYRQSSQLIPGIWCRLFNATWARQHAFHVILAVLCWISKVPETPKLLCCRPSSWSTKSQYSTETSAKPSTYDNRRRHGPPSKTSIYRKHLSPKLDHETKKVIWW